MSSPGSEHKLVVRLEGSSSAPPKQPGRGRPSVSRATTIALSIALLVVGAFTFLSLLSSNASSASVASTQHSHLIAVSPA